ncbi:unnamed protein product [Schistosoma mattheei]|uniref:tRNA (adenine(58)-N(1))-methyltransferase non-catalytic subunit TRM6 n=1 Tax=Schistosoma mattheei TaxID=31246 RepID=A0A183PD32_9TREM|nr:unnamed protein product [Schistosoma mattheei]
MTLNSRSQAPQGLLKEALTLTCKRSWASRSIIISDGSLWNPCTRFKKERTRGQQLTTVEQEQRKSRNERNSQKQTSRPASSNPPDIEAALTDLPIDITLPTIREIRMAGHQKNQEWYVCPECRESAPTEPKKEKHTLPFMLQETLSTPTSAKCTGTAKDAIISVITQDIEIPPNNEEKYGAVGLKDNRNIKVSQANQKLSGSYIEQLRLNGDILDQLVEGNLNFEQKTPFSQQKYLKKKKDRHLSLFSIEKPKARICFEIFSNLRPEKCLGLRFETVCRILSYANIHAGSTVLLCETCSGLITAATLERIGTDQPKGSVIQFYHGSSFPQSEISSAYTHSYSGKV